MFEGGANALPTIAPSVLPGRDRDKEIVAHDSYDPFRQQRPPAGFALDRRRSVADLGVLLPRHLLEHAHHLGVIDGSRTERDEKTVTEQRGSPCPHSLESKNAMRGASSTSTRCVCRTHRTGRRNCITSSRPSGRKTSSSSSTPTRPSTCISWPSGSCSPSIPPRTCPMSACRSTGCGRARRSSNRPMNRCP